MTATSSACPAGTYTVEETSAVPEGYAKAPTVTITIASNGTICDGEW